MPGWRRHPGQSADEATAPGKSRSRLVIGGVVLVLAFAGIVAVVLWRIVAVHTGQAEFGLYAQTPARLDAPLMGALAAGGCSIGRMPGPEA